MLSFLLIKSNVCSISGYYVSAIDLHHLFLGYLETSSALSVSVCLSFAVFLSLSVYLCLSLSVSHSLK